MRPYKNCAKLLIYIYVKLFKKYKKVSLNIFKLGPLQSKELFRASETRWGRPRQYQTPTYKLKKTYM